MARRVGPSGRVTATDVSPEMLAALASSAEKANLAREHRLPRGEAPRGRSNFPDDSSFRRGGVHLRLKSFPPRSTRRSSARSGASSSPAADLYRRGLDEPRKNPSSPRLSGPSVDSFLTGSDPKAPAPLVSRPPASWPACYAPGDFSDFTVEPAFQSDVRSVPQHCKSSRGINRRRRRPAAGHSRGRASGA